MKEFPEFEITDFELYAIEHEFIVGFANIYLPQVGITLHRGCVRRDERADSGFLVCLPRRRRVRKDGSVESFSVVTFPDRRRFFAFSNAIIEALREAHPEAFTSPVPPSSFTTPQGVDHHA